MVKLILAAIPFRAWLVGGALAAILALYSLGVLSGASGERAEEALRDADAEIETLERMNNADTSRGDPDADREWLRNRAEGGHPGGR